jgi:uncharacterized protein (DUF58 family)
MAGSPPIATRWRSLHQLFRIASLLVPAVFALAIASDNRDRDNVRLVLPYVLGPLWCVMVALFARRVVSAIVRHRRDRASGVSFLDRVDLLTASGSALSWLASAAIVLSVWIGWASLSAVGLLGLGSFHFVAIWALFVTHGDDPWRRSSLSRRFLTERAVEGGPVIEELHFSAPRIPVGFRLFACGRVGPRWTTSRYVVDGGDDGSEIRLESDVGPAIRGEHQAEPLEVWLQDVFGLCHSMRSRVGSAPLVVLPRRRAVRGAKEILRTRDALDEPRVTPRAPTEGSLLLREYQVGDDARRIHWARSTSTQQILVRTPDETPCDRRAVRLVLDTYLPDHERFSCPAPAELLDTLVAVWLGVARTFGGAGLRVELVVVDRDRVRIVPMSTRAAGSSKADELGARAAWQSGVSLERMLTNRPSVVVSYRHQPLPDGTGATSWVLAREWAWVGFDQRPQVASMVVLPHPMGSPENSGGRRRRERQAYARARADHGRFTRLCGDQASSGARAGASTFLATPSLGGAIHVEKLS